MKDMIPQPEALTHAEEVALRVSARFIDRALELAAEALGWLALRIECYRVGHDWKEAHCLQCYHNQFPAKALVQKPSIRVCERCEFVERLGELPKRSKAAYLTTAGGS